MAEQWLTADQISRSFWFSMTRPGIRLRWSPALVAKLAKVNEGRTPWQEEPRWLRLMPQLTTWYLIDD